MASIPEEKKKTTKPLILYFVPKIIPGKSYVRVGLSYDTPHTVTEKFYTKERYNIDQQDINAKADKLKTSGPKEKYGRCVTENQKYGWYHLWLTNKDLRDRRLNFTKNTDQWIKLYLMTTDVPGKDK